MVPLIEANIRLNRNFHTELTTKDVCALAYPWGTTPSNALLESLNMVIMSDVVYDPVFYQPLVHSIEMLLMRPSTVCIMAHRHRHPEDHKFFALLEETGFQATQIPYQPSEALRDACQDVKLLRIARVEVGR